MSVKQAILLASFLFLFGFQLQSQTFYALKIDRKLRFEAVDITRKYQPHLVMGADQAQEFRQVVAKFLVKKRAVEQDTLLSPGARYYHLKKLSNKETAEMAQVLEHYKWRYYMQIKSEIQPLPKPPGQLREDLIATHPYH